MSILDSATASAVAAATNQTAQLAALLAPWAGGNVTARVMSGATLLSTLTQAPWVVNGGASPRSAALGARLARTFAANGSPTRVVFRAGSTDIFELSAAVGSGSVSFAAAIDVLRRERIEGVTVTAMASLPLSPPAPPPPPPPPPAPALTFVAGASSGTAGGASIAGPTISAPGGNVGSVAWALTSSPAGQTATPASGTLAPGASVTPTLNAVSAAIYAISVANNSGGTVNGAASPGSAGNVQWYAPTPPPPPPPPPAPAPSTGTPQPFTLTSSSSGSLPFAIGYAMSQGHVPSGQSLSFAGATAKLTVLSTWPDGSARHGIIAGTYTSGGSAVTVTPTVATVTAGTALTGAAVQTAMGANTAVFDAGAFGSATFSGADFATPFKTHAATDGFIEAIYRKAIGSDAHLVAWLALRVWSSGAVEALPWVENGFIRVTGPTNKSATYKFTLGGVEKFNAAIDLPHHTRTPLVSGAALSHWLGTDPAVVVKHDSAYLMATRLVPSYSATVSPSASAVTGLASTYTPLQVGNFTATMGVAGYQPTLGILPEWDALYLTSTASSVWAALQRNGYSAGRWGIHYRDENTHRPLKFSDFPNLSTNSSSTSDYPPSPTGTAPGAWDIPHHPSVGYMAYLVTGRWFHMETVLFAATNNYLFQVDSIRQTSQGIFRPSSGASTLRGAAWCLRTLAQAATVVPDADTALKAEFVASLEANINANHAQYVAQSNNPYGMVETYGDNSTGSDGIWTTAMWQQDFFTACAGYMLAMDPPISGTVRAKLAAFFEWKAKSIVGRFSPASDTNGWLYRDAACYTGTLAFTDSPNWVNGAGPWPSTWRSMYDSTFDGVQNPAPGSFVDGDLRGSSSANPALATGYWANLIPAISYAVEHGAAGAQAAWDRMTGASNWATLATAFNTDCVWSVKPARPTWVPASGVRTGVSTNTIASVYPTTAPDSRTRGAPAILSAWCSTTFAPGLGTLGSILAWGGGHADYLGDETYRYDIASRTWSRITEPWDILTTGVQASEVLDGTYMEFWTDESRTAVVPGRVGPTHTYGHNLYVPGSAAGNTAGWLVIPGNFGFQTHYLNLDNPSAGWARIGGLLSSVFNEQPGYGCSLFDATRSRVVCFPYTNGVQSKAQTVAVPGGTLGTINVNYMRTYYGVAHHMVSDDLYVIVRASTPVDADGLIQIHDPVSSTKYNPASSGTTPPTDTIGTVEWIEGLRQLVFWPGTGSTVYFGQAPANPRTGTWVWTSRTFSGDTPAVQASANPMYKRFHYVPALNAILHVAQTTGPVQAWAL